MNNMINRKASKIRTVSVNERGQIVIPEDIRKDLGITKASTLVIIESQGEIVLKKEEDILEAVKGEDEFWKIMAMESMKKAWNKEDEIWDKIYQRRKR